MISKKLFSTKDKQKMKRKLNSITLPTLDTPPLDSLVNFRTNTYWGVADREKFKSLMDEVVKLVSPGFHLSDNLFTWSRNNSLFEDKTFLKSWKSNIQNPSDEAIAWRRYILATSAHHAIHLEGDFVECGVYLGTGVKVVCDYLGSDIFPKTFWAYDTYDFNPVDGHRFENQKDGLFEKVKLRFKDYPQVKIIKGLIPDAFKDNCPEKIAYLHIDLNNASSEIATLDFLFDRIVPGGMVILDDYEWSGFYRPQKLEEDAWFHKRQYRIMPLPTGQGLIIKR